MIKQTDRINNLQMFIFAKKKIKEFLFNSSNSIIRLSIHDFHLLEKFKWESSTNDINICRNQIQSLVLFLFC